MLKEVGGLGIEEEERRDCVRRRGSNKTHQLTTVCGFLGVRLILLSQILQKVLNGQRAKKWRGWGGETKHPSRATNGRSCVVWDNYHYRATSIQQATFKLASRLSLPSEGCVIARHGPCSGTRRRTHTDTHAHAHPFLPLHSHCSAGLVM